MLGDEEHVLYKDRPEWNDVEPIDIDQDEDSVIRIAYSESFKDCYGYLRAVLRSGELSERVHELTTTCAYENPSCYTVWRLRRKVLAHLKMDIDKELSYMTSQIVDNPKNYQVWYHRQKLIEWNDDPKGELEFTALMLNHDAKNYHAWQYRQWVLGKFNLWASELEFCDKLLKEDCRNNSAWNQRYYVIKNSTGFTEEVVKRELDYVIDSIRELSYNESSWNYLRGILKHATDKQRNEVMKFLEEEFCPGKKSVFSLSILLEIYESAGEKALAQKTADILKEQDVLRSSYWDFRSRLLQEE